MSWAYSQSTGVLTWNGAVAGAGYSGVGGGRNNPFLQRLSFIGPIPQGNYDIGSPNDTPDHGPFVLPLTPRLGTITFGRSGFTIHGDLNDFSQGCTILSLVLRHRIWSSGDRKLVVTL